MYEIGYESLEREIYSSAGYSIEAMPFNEIERVVSEFRQTAFYGGNIYSGYRANDKYAENKIYAAHPEIFLEHHRPFTTFINTSEEVKELIEQAFRLTMSRELPGNLSIKVCNLEELRKQHGNNFNDGIIGFSVNNGIVNQIFVKEDSLDRLMVTIGHEIGHILTPTVKDRISEEAKAFAFEFAWVDAIKENNIGNLGMCLRRAVPAKNNLHDAAFEFVLNRINEEKNALELFYGLSKGEVCRV